ncbi:hypothetical protein ABIC27_000911 [Streptomyces sp. PvR034]
MTVSAASRMFRAISFGVFCRDAPSTRAIMRSMKLCPGREATRTTIESDSTVVPPVTPERSPPDARITAADSPVTADSSTAAAPSMTSPSARISSPASTSTTSRGCSSLGATASVSACRGFMPYVQCRSRSATVSVRALRSDSAWARPRPSATASARLAKRTVSQSQTLITQVKTDGWMSADSVVSTEPTPTTNSTGFRISSRGASLRTASRREAVGRIDASRGRAAGRVLGGRLTGACGEDGTGGTCRVAAGGMERPPGGIGPARTGDAPPRTRPLWDPVRLVA